MRRSGDTAADFLALGSCQCLLKIFGVAVGLRGCRGVALGVLVTRMTGSTATGSRTCAISSLSALVSVSCEKVLPTVVCSGGAPTFGGGVGVPALIATTAPRPIKQRIASHTVLITATPRMVEICELIVSVGLNQALKGRAGRKL